VPLLDSIFFIPYAQCDKLIWDLNLSQYGGHILVQFDYLCWFRVLQKKRPRIKYIGPLGTPRCKLTHAHFRVHGPTQNKHIQSIWASIAGRCP
jgi:hypothetical protein